MDALKVICTETGEVVNSIDITGKSERTIDKIEMGLMRKVNFDLYHVERTPAVQAGTAQGGEP